MELTLYMHVVLFIVFYCQNDNILIIHYFSILYL